MFFGACVTPAAELVRPSLIARPTPAHILKTRAGLQAINPSLRPAQRPGNRLGLRSSLGSLLFGELAV